MIQQTRLFRAQLAHHLLGDEGPSETAFRKKFRPNTKAGHQRRADPHQKPGPGLGAEFDITQNDSGHHTASPDEPGDHAWQNRFQKQ